jgi:transcriptional regulator with XRE-family HTH domain
MWREMHAAIEIRGEQLRAARSMLGWTQDDLGEQSGISRNKT